MDSRSSLRLLIVGLNYAPEETGIAPYTAGVAAGLARLGHEVSVITAHPHYPQWRIADGYGGWSSQERVQNVDVTRVRHYVPRRPVGLPRALSELSFGVRVVGCAWRNPDVVLCVSPALLSTAMVLARVRRPGHGAAVGVILQDLYSVGVEEQGGSRKIAAAFRSIESWTTRRVDGVAVIHDRFKDRVVGALGVPAHRVSVVRNWTHLRKVEDVDRTAIRRTLGWFDEETVVLHSGAMGQKQDLVNVVEAARIAERRHERFRFVLMGDGGQRRTLEDRGRGLTNLQFIDPLPNDDFSHALRSADVLLVNERAGIKEMAVPSKLTSYFSTGLPVLAATDADSTTAEEIRASSAGVVVRPGDPEALLVAARDLAHDPARALAIGAHGPSYCDRVLSEAVAIDAYDRWVRELHARRRNIVGSAKED